MVRAASISLVSPQQTVPQPIKVLNKPVGQLVHLLSSHTDVDLALPAPDVEQGINLFGEGGVLGLTVKVGQHRDFVNHQPDTLLFHPGPPVLEIVEDIIKGPVHLELQEGLVILVSSKV